MYTKVGSYSYLLMAGEFMVSVYIKKKKTGSVV